MQQTLLTLVEWTNLATYTVLSMFSVGGTVLSCDNAVNLDCNNPGACSDCLGYDQTDQDLLDVANSVPPLIGHIHCKLSK